MRVASVRRFACAAIPALAIIASGPSGQGRTVAAVARLDYAAATGCPPPAEFEAIVEGRLGYHAFAADAPDGVIVRIASTSGALEGRLEWRHATGESIGERVFPSRTGDCAELARAMAFALAVQFQLMAVNIDESRPAPIPTASPTVTTTLPAPPPLAPTHLVQEDRPGRSDAAAHTGGFWLVGGGASAGLGVAPDPTAVGRLFGTLEWPHVAIELGAEASLPGTLHRADGAGFSQTQVLVGLAGCGVRSAWSLCAVGKAGELRVAGRDIGVPLTASAPVLQAGLRLGASHGIFQRMYVAGRAEALARLTRGTVTLDAMPVWRTPRVAALFGIDVGFRFE